MLSDVVVLNANMMHDSPPSLRVINFFSPSLGGVRANEFKLLTILLHATISLFKPSQKFRDRIACLSNFHTNCIPLSSSKKKLCVLGFWPWSEGGFGLL